MRVDILKILSKADERVMIECVEITPEIEQIQSYVLTKGKELSGWDEGKLYRFCLEDVLYFEAVDEKVFAYTDVKLYEMKIRLYEIEEAYQKFNFIRCSKSVVMNLMKLACISPALNGRFSAHMKNGEKLMITRQYVPLLKSKITGSNNK